jgi:hypothetical protein
MFFFQMFPIAVTCGNTFVLKPCEKNPGDFTIDLFMYSLLLSAIEFFFLRWKPLQDEANSFESNHTSGIWF